MPYFYDRNLGAWRATPLLSIINKQITNNAKEICKPRSVYFSGSDGNGVGRRPGGVCSDDVATTHLSGADIADFPIEISRIIDFYSVRIFMKFRRGSRFPAFDLFV
jgi:hypothetical protein